MDELVDFEELIDLNLSLPSASESSEEPITDILYKMCEAMDESSITMNNILKNDENDGLGADDDIANLDEFENLLATASLCNDNLVTNDMLEINENKNGEIAPDDVVDDDVVNLDEFETLLATAALCNDERNTVTDDISDIIDSDMFKMPDETINLDEFESISANACLFIDDEGTKDNGHNNISNVQRVSSYEVPVEFEDVYGHTTEHDVIKEKNITANKYSVHKISLESTATSNKSENCIYLETFEFSTVNAIFDKVKTVNKEYDNGLATVKAEPNVTDDIITITINDSEVKYVNAVETSDCKNTIETVTEHSENKNTDSDDGYDSSDFEFISEHEASKVGIFTRMSKITTNKTNSTAQSISNNAKNSLLTQHEQQNTSGQSTCNNIDNGLGKNEASLSEYIKYSKYRYQRCYSRPASELHVIPEGESYLDMFRGEYAPEVVNNLYSLRNKSVLSAVAMAANLEELAYCDPGQVDENNEKYKDDADDCLEKILSTYRYEN